VNGIQASQPRSDDRPSASRFPSITPRRSNNTGLAFSAHLVNLCAADGPPRFGRMRDLEVIDSELRLLARRSPGVPRAGREAAFHRAGRRTAGRNVKRRATYRTAAGPTSTRHATDHGGAYTVAPHSHAHVM
jgi:hypothetical protein